MVEKILEVINPDLIREKANSISEIINLSSMIKDYLELNLMIANRLDENINIAAEKTISSLEILTDALIEISKAKESSIVTGEIDKARSLISETLVAYCVRCKTKIESNFNVRTVKMKNGKYARTGNCPTCGSKVFRIGVKE